MGGCGYVAFVGEMVEELADLGFGHVFWVAFVVEEDVAAYPADVSVFGVDGVVLEACGLSDLVEEFGFLFR